MVVGKLDCNRVVVKAEDGRMFVADQRDFSCMTLMEADSPPKEGEPTQNVVPFRRILPRKMWAYRLNLFRQEA